jgi:hypothetical protein
MEWIFGVGLLTSLHLMSTYAVTSNSRPTLMQCSGGHLTKCDLSIGCSSIHLHLRRLGRRLLRMAAFYTGDPGGTAALVADRHGGATAVQCMYRVRGCL